MAPGTRLPSIYGIGAAPDIARCTLTQPWSTERFCLAEERHLLCLLIVIAIYRSNGPSWASASTQKEYLFVYYVMSLKAKPKATYSLSHVCNGNKEVTSLALSLSYIEGNSS